jgi:DEAD/DEAH box helicase domain-containing protein
MDGRVPEPLRRYPSYTDWLKSLPGYEGQIAAYSFFPLRLEGDYLTYSGKFRGVLEALAIIPYRHQSEALSAIEAGCHLVIATPTASGKSLIYQVPTLHALQRGECALYLFPTKALSHDQQDKLLRLAQTVDVAKKIASYDGDTPVNSRQLIRQQVGCLLTNPDMLHYGILPYHRNWAHFFGALRYLVIDEIHAYRGVMGTHVANILRRLLRVARHYGASPQIIAASATIANPAQHAHNLTGETFAALTEDFGPRAARELIFWQPPLVSKHGDGRRRSANTEAAWLAGHCIKAGLKSIFFCNARKTAELLSRYAQNYLSDAETGLLKTYRAGYTVSDRREIERRFRTGELRVLTATSALELGVDIGGVDAVVLVGYPGSMTSLWQRAGRAGRHGTRALTVMIAADDPLDEYYLNHPDAITEGRVERAVADPFNTEIHPLHVACAAFEKPITPPDNALAAWFTPDATSKVVLKNGRYHYLGRYPHRSISIRGTGGRQITLKDGDGKTLGISDYASSLRELHPGAVYLHMGRSYLVAELNLAQGVATLLPHIEDYYTQTRSVTEIAVVTPEFSVHGVTVGRVRVTTHYTSFVKKRYFSEAILDERLLDLPEVSYLTQALWISMAEVMRQLPAADLPSGMHALEHALIGLLPAFVLCERADVGGVSYPLYPAAQEPRIFIYDGYPGGVGYAQAGASLFPEWLEAVAALLRECPCKTGCPRCILSPKCGNGNQQLDKHAAKVLANELLARLTPRRATTLN